MKRLLRIGAFALPLLSAAVANAWTYTNEEVLLVFRKPGYNDVLFKIGNISQFLNKPNGYTTTVSGWDLSQVTSTFGSDLTADVRVILLATTSSVAVNRRAWLSSAEPNTQPHNRTSSQWQSQLYAKINAIGDKPQAYTSFSATPYYVVAPTHISSYDYIASNAGQQNNDIPKLGGASTFTVEQAIPASLKFWEITPDGTSTPAALIGNFTLDANGVLTFTAGGAAVSPTAATIVGITRTNGVSTVTFTTGAWGNYKLHFSNTLNGPPATWSVVAGPVAGDGTNHGLSHTNSDDAGYYAIEATP